MAESVAWLVIGAAMLAHLRAPAMPVSTPTPQAPDATKELDPSRWSYDESWWRGNKRAPAMNNNVQELSRYV